MRAMFVVFGSVLICVSLFGCNRSQQAQAPVPAPVVATAPVCNCPQLAQASAPVVKRHGHRWRRHWNGGSNVSHEASWLDRESPSSSYSPSGESEYSSANNSADSEDGIAGAPIPPPPGAPFPAPQVQGGVWVDGYGRGHYTIDAQESDDGDVADLTAKDIGRRLAPYHAYNVDCDKAQ